MLKIRLLFSAELHNRNSAHTLVCEKGTNQKELVTLICDFGTIQIVLMALRLISHNLNSTHGSGF